MKHLKTYEERYLSDEEISDSYSNYTIETITIDSEDSGSISIQFPYGEDKYDNWIKYDNGRIAFDHWYPDWLYLELCEFINQRLEAEKFNL